MNVLDLFSGIGGFSLGLERAGMKTVAFCEIDPFCQKVLKKHWPGVPIFGDIKELYAESISETIDLMCGGYPCQPFSLSGKRRGEEDDRHLWPEYLRLIREVRPSWIIAENVTGHINMGLDEVLADLEGENYSWWAFIIPACAVGKRHRRDRVWIVANSKCYGFQGRSVISAERFDKPIKEQLAGFLFSCSWPSLSIARTYRADDGISDRVHRNKALGNAVVPQIPEIIGRAIMEIESKG